MRPYRRIGGALAVLLVALLANLSWLQVIGADSIRSRNGNSRLLLEQYNRARGPIIVDAVPIATSARSASDGFYQRSYMDGPLYAAVTGYYSLLYGATGIERSQNGVLSGSDSRFLVDRIQQLFAGRHQAGGAVTLSIDAAAQRAAYGALGHDIGAVVAINARTGAVLALVSTPSFDPQLLAPNDPEQVRANYQALTADPAQPLVNRAVGRTYAPGFPFAIVTAAAALSSGRFESSTALPAPASLALGSTRLHNADNRECGPGTVSLARAVRTGCLTALASLGQLVGGDALRNTAEQFGLGSALLTQLPTHVSSMTAASDIAHVSLAAVGQGGVQVTALQMALLSAAIANDGTLMDPYLVEDVRARNLAVLDHATPTVHSTPLSTRVAAAIGSMMLGINGDATCADCHIGSHVVHSLSGGNPMWMTAYAGDVAVAAVVETPTRSGTTGAHAAQAVVVSVLRAVLAKS